MISAPVLKCSIRNVCVCLLLATPLAATTVRIYVANYADTTVDVIDPATNKVIQVIDGIPRPHGVACSPDGRRVYVTSEAEGLLDVVDPKTGRIIKRIALSGTPNNIAVTKDGKKVLVCIRYGAGALDVVDTTTLERIKTIPVKGGLHNVLVTRDGKCAAASAPSAHAVVVFDLKTDEPVWSVKFDHETRMLALERNADGSTRRIFVQLEYFHGFAVVDFAAHKEVAKVKLPDEPRGFEAEATPSGPTHGIAVNPDNKTLWVCSASNRCVFVYSLPRLKLLGHVTTGVHPAWVTFSPDGRIAYVSNTTREGSVSVINSKTLKELTRISVGHNPMRTAALVTP